MCIPKQDDLLGRHIFLINRNLEILETCADHVVVFLEMLNVCAEKPVGRRLDFLMQELNREANTLGSKSADTEMTRGSVDLKVLIEQMREQIQNIE